MTFESLPENEQPQAEQSPIIRRRGMNRSDLVVGVLFRRGPFHPIARRALIDMIAEPASLRNLHARDELRA